MLTPTQVTRYTDVKISRTMIHYKLYLLLSRVIRTTTSEKIRSYTIKVKARYTLSDTL